ncbi:MAG: hypothetical protein K9K66_11930 [Desulfarculaceae bacterium]|nr:hypothetical protein [Desulfarculaceae bacterium]MCF8071540.1 hypothetical protein [Desulfarculaceae bacterium]MCF8102355.1 hypothetical protein [Desulfarculaceae bacterium]MCF8114819.1 hypothetical protein [Desulfarculaceae bacterium]
MSENKPILTACSPAAPDLSAWELAKAGEDISEADQETYLSIVSTELTPEQREMVITPSAVYPRQKELLAIHWHPEWIPMELIARRIEAMFPNVEQSLIIPTQHNQLLTWGQYSGVEIDCYSSGFQRKVQLLLHFNTSKLNEAGVLKSMLAHTFKYRSSQLLQFMATIVEPAFEADLEEAVMTTGAGEEVVAFVRFYTARLGKLMELYEQQTPPTMIKNKLLTEYIEAMGLSHPGINLRRALLLLSAVKKIVKRKFSLEYFYRASEVIEETRSLGGGVVIPHPEQFWPILLADYDVDGYEVWNPQSREYTEFLIRALTRKNREGCLNGRELLIFMGDDTHLSVKIKDPERVEHAKLEREVGLQPAWDELAISKSLSLANASRAQIIEQYRARLG